MINLPTVITWSEDESQERLDEPPISWASVESIADQSATTKTLQARTTRPGLTMAAKLLISSRKLPVRG